MRQSYAFQALDFQALEKMSVELLTFQQFSLNLHL